MTMRSPGRACDLSQTHQEAYPQVAYHLVHTCNILFRILQLLTLCYFRGVFFSFLFFFCLRIKIARMYCTHYDPARFNYRALHPRGIIAAATSVTPRSVASRLNCAEALRVSWISTLIPSELMCLFVWGDNGIMVDPNPNTKMSRK